MITLQDIKLRSKINNEDSLLNSLIDVAKNQWLLLTGKNFGVAQSITEQHWMEGYAPKNLFTHTHNVSEVTLIRERYIGHRSCGTDLDWTVLLTTEYVLTSSRGHIIRLNSSWRNMVEVVYTAGVTADEVPAAVKYALVTQVLHLRKRNSESLISLKGQSFQGGQGSFHEADYHPAFLSTVKLYKDGANG